MKYPKQDGDMIKYHEQDFYYNNKVIKMNVYTVRYDIGSPFRVIRIVSDNDHPEYNGAICVDYNSTSTLSLSTITFKGTLPEITQGIYKNDTVYKVPYIDRFFELNGPRYLYILVSEGKYLNFYPEISDDDTYDILSHLVFTSPSKNIFRESIYDFLCQLMGEYRIYGQNT